MSRSYAKTLAAAGATIGLLGCSWKGELIEDAFLHTPTVQESQIGNILLKAYGEKVDIICVPQEELRERMWPVGSSMERTDGVAARWLSKIWLDTEVCNGIQLFAERPTSQKKDLTEEEQHAIRVVAHESRHIAGTDNEGQADCEAVQVADKLIRALGTGYGDSRLINAWIAYEVTDEAGDRPAEYSLASCRRGSPWELNPGDNAMFPKPLVQAAGE